MKHIITIDYNYSTDDTRLKVSPNFAALPAIHRADALRDALHELAELYNETIQKIGKDAA